MKNNKKQEVLASRYNLNPSKKRIHHVRIEVKTCIVKNEHLLS